MERLSQRESVLLGYSPQRSLINHNSSSPKNSDIDFNDVFGGPPRRSSMHGHEMRYSFSETADDNGLKGVDETLVSRDSWNGLSEKPVFGQEGLNRRRYPSDNFFNDIFKGNESLSSSPRKRDFDPPFGSSPGSRVLSHAWPLPPKADPFGTSVPAQFSLPARLTKGMDLPAFGSSPHSPHKSKDGASNGLGFYSHAQSKSSSLSPNQEEKNDTKSTYRQSLLSRELSLSCKESSKLIGYDGIGTGGDSKEESSSSESVTNGNQFHFSIYKWASKGVPLVMPLRGGSKLRLKESDNTEKSSTSEGRIESESVARELSTATLHDTKLPSHNQEEKNDTKSTYRQSLLSRELSLSCKESSKLIGYDGIGTGGDSKEESSSSESVTNGNQFHFSIYKWDSKGVPLVMPLRGGSKLRLKESDNTEKSSTSEGRIESESVAREISTATLHDTKLPSHNIESAATDKFPVMEQDKQDNGSLPDTMNQDKVEAWQIADPDKATSQCAGEEAKPHSDIGLFDELKKNISVVDEEAPKPELKPLRSLFVDYDHEQGSEKINNKASGKESKVEIPKMSSIVLDFSKNTKQQDGKKTTNDSSRAGKVSLQGSLGDSGKTGVRGKVKEFIKIFNQEAFPKPKSRVDSQTHSNRWKEIGTSKPEREAKFSKIGTDTKTHMPNRHDKKSLADAYVVVNEHLQCSEKQHSATKNANRISNGTPQKKDRDGSVTASIPNGLKAVEGDVDDTFQANFQVKELVQDENKMMLAGNDPEEIQDVDAKIRQWSNGKEGNIRSLLSTLQYVLWPGSGWKPVPLVDIIEANAVKRSYQKALLCLHPDKLQQKGAVSHQKYIAEKVFDILQDAWTHFSSLGSL